MARPKLIILAGPPAAGKTTSAPLLAQVLDVPLFGLDEIKERLADSIGPDALEYADQMALAAMDQMISIAHELLSCGRSVMIEGFIRHGESEELIAPLLELCDAVLVHLRADDAVLKHRYETRALHPERHWIHGDIARLGTLTPELPPELAAPLDLGISRIFIDTSHGPIIVDELASLITNVFQAAQPEDYESITAQSPAES